MSITANFPAIRPTLNLDFVNSLTVDPRIAFTRASTATYFDRLGVLRTAATNEPRIDFDPATLVCRGLLIEERRTNLLTFSERCWDTAQWAVGRTLANFYTVTNSTDVPNIYGGTTGVAKFVANATTTELFLRKFITLGADTYAPSIFIYMPSQAGVTSWRLRVDVADAEGSAFTAASTTFDRWVHVQIPAVTTTASRNFLDFNIYQNGVAPSPGFTFYAMGAQLEVGAFHTSYIPTTSSQVTRSVDIAVMTGTNFSSWYRQDEGTLFAEASATFANRSQHGIIFQAAYDNNNNHCVAYRNILIDDITIFTRIAGNYVFSPIDTGDPNWTLDKVGYSYSSAGGSVVLNSALITSSSSNLAINATALYLGKNLENNSFLNGHIRRITYWPTRLPNTVLQTITA